MDTIQLDLSKKYNYADYLTWFDDKRRELFNGFVKLMSPAPSATHQKISWNITAQLSPYLKNNKCSAFYAPFDVRFPDDNETSDSKIYTVVQPDICIICDPSKIDERGCLGPPDMIIEIISKNNPKRDVQEKFLLYEEYKVREYWIVHPNDRTVTVFLLNEKYKYHLIGIFAGDTKVKVNILANFMVDLNEVFTE